ncbi:MAG: hypothetical protein QHC78_01015 [Pigmentiphaga sp.]|uniref:hypothetical protein n=1 Tax=Pigmentiphaga sp. TaxID=1977564 RepID=UPI0029A55C45|nr:hypothetical protein [Pigmentiphaga sp.]MDX3904257.1 hypothetical protein [Pigmentiphaga sp.]
MLGHLSLAVLTLVFLHACINAPAPRATRPATQAETAPQGLPRYDAERVYADFTAHDPQALEKYRKTPFVVSGWLQKIHPVGHTELQLDLKAASPAQPVRARLKSDLACERGQRCPEQVALDTLPRGFKVYLKCNEATLQGATPTVGDCVLTGGPGPVE